MASGARCGGRPVSASIAWPLQYVSRQPLPPQMHGRPSGSTTTWPMYPALPMRPCSSLPPLTTPPPTPVPITTPMKSLTPTAPPHHASARASALASVSTDTGSCTSSCISVSSGNCFHVGMYRGDTVWVDGIDRTAAPDSATHRIGGRRGQHAQDQPGQGRPHVAGRRQQRDREPGSARNRRRRPRRAWCHRRRRRGSNGSRAPTVASRHCNSAAPPSTLPGVTAIQTAPTRTFASLFEAITGNVARVVQGKKDAIELAVSCLLAEGHLLIEDVPGVGKTSLAKALAASITARGSVCSSRPTCSRPTSSASASTSGRASRSSSSAGPLFANIVLADEINRASPKTQSALARGDGGTPGQRRRRQPHRCPSRSWSSPRRTRSSRKAPTACRRASSTGS